MQPLQITEPKIVLPGGAGLVGQNLVVRLKQRGFRNLVVLDKNPVNLRILSSLHPGVTAIDADLAESGPWEQHFQNADAVVILQAQIGALAPEFFSRNNITATERVITAIKKYRVPYTIHVSSSVVNSAGSDQYTLTKRAQERLVLESGIKCVVLRPTLMFGWFDRKHLGWLSRFMLRVPVFPIPGHGRYMRQPLYVGDFCNVIANCLESRIDNRVFDVTGIERIEYVEIIRQIRRATRSHCLIVKIPYWLFSTLLDMWAVFDRNPPFTSDQLRALTAGDEFDVIDWEGIFGVKATPFSAAIDETFNDPKYSRIALQF